MVKAVVYTLLATAFIIFFLFSSSQKENGHDHLRLYRRIGDRSRAQKFDPLAAKMERLAEERGLGNIGAPNNLKKDFYPGEVVNADEYFSDQGILNITLRLIVLFPMVDTNPKDGLISLKELEAWNILQAVERLNYLTQKEIESYAKNGDGAISFKEYLPQFSDEDIAKNETGYGDAGWWHEQFLNADIDQNGILSFEEFKNFLHPRDSNNENIQQWLLRERVQAIDQDKDGKVSFEEFLESAYDTFKNYIEFETAGMDALGPEAKFAELDVNKDKYLVAEELRPILRYLVPGEILYAKYYASYLMHEADENRDGFLTLDEMLNHENVFYNTAYQNTENEYDYHVEL